MGKVWSRRQELIVTMIQTHDDGGDPAVNRRNCAKSSSIREMRKRLHEQDLANMFLDVQACKLLS